jgi:hypothetical protein
LIHILLRIPFEPSRVNVTPVKVALATTPPDVVLIPAAALIVRSADEEPIVATSGLIVTGMIANVFELVPRVSSQTSFPEGVPTISDNTTESTYVAANVAPSFSAIVLERTLTNNGAVAVSVSKSTKSNVATDHVADQVGS